MKTLPDDMGDSLLKSVSHFLKSNKFSFAGSSSSVKGRLIRPKEYRYSFKNGKKSVTISFFEYDDRIRTHFTRPSRYYVHANTGEVIYEKPFIRFNNEFKEFVIKALKETVS